MRATLQPDGLPERSVKLGRIAAEVVWPQGVVGAYHEDRPDKRLGSVQEMPDQLVGAVREGQIPKRPAR